MKNTPVSIATTAISAESLSNSFGVLKSLPLTPKQLTICICGCIVAGVAIHCIDNNCILDSTVSFGDFNAGIRIKPYNFGGGEE